MIDADVKNEIDCLKTYLEMVIAAQNTLNNEKITADREALRAAMAANDKRLEVMNEFRLTLSDQANSMITRHESEAALDALADKSEQMRISLETKLESETKSLNVKVDQIGRPNWPLLASAISIFLMMITGVWLVIGLKIDSTLTPLSLSIQEAKVTVSAINQRVGSVELLASASTTADATSRLDRSEMNERLRKLDALVGSTNADRAELTQKLAEIETQFCASDIIRNLMHASDMRITSMLWKKAFPGSAYPTDNAFYPIICNRSVPPNSKN